MQLNAGMFLANFISIHAPPRGATVQLVQRVRPRAISIHAPPRGATRFSNHRCIFLLFQFTPLREGRPVFFVSSEFSSVVFQFTPLREGRRYTACVGGTGILFQFTPLREGRRYTACVGGTGILFQFTPLREGRRRRPSSRRWCWMHFNSRPSARGDKSAKAALQPLAYFNSRPSARGDYIVPSPCCQGAISIHAPPRGATCPRRTTPSPRRYFNSRPSARGDARIPAPRCECANFNSRPSARGDPKKCDLPLDIYISIHAPPRGATRKTSKRRKNNLFQFTPLREGRHGGMAIRTAGLEFQFTPLREGRRAMRFVALVGT